MKDAIHPNYDTCTVKCACGATFETKSTKGDMKVDICSKCHPFYTGQQKATQARGRIDKFNKKYGINKQKKVVTDKVEVIKSQPFLEHGNSMRKTWFLK